MKNKLIIHAGLHKTGTSFIQEHLAFNKEKLRTNGWDFLHLDESGNSSSMIRVTLENGDIKALISENFLKLLNNSRCDNAIISAEYLSFIDDIDELIKLKEMASQFYSDVIVLFYIRRQDELALSFKQQAAKSPSACAMPSSMLLGHSDGALPRVDSKIDTYFNFYKKLSLWAKVFSKENIVIDIYNKKTFNSCYLTSFLLRCGLQIGDVNIKTKAINEGLSRRESIIYHEILKLGLNKKNINISPYELDDGKKILPSRKEMMDFYNRYEDSNRKLFADFSITDSFDFDFEKYPEFSDYDMSCAEREIVRNIISFNSQSRKELVDVDLVNEIRDFAFYKACHKYDFSALNILSKLKVVRNHGSKINEQYSNALKKLSSDSGFSVEFRVNYYLGCYLNKNKCFFNEYKRDEIFIYRNTLNVITPGSYVIDINRVIAGIDADIPVVFGDKTHDTDAAYFCKARNIRTRSGILLRLNKNRHWKEINGFKDQIKFDAKIPLVVWRGASTGFAGKEFNIRYRFVERYFNSHNVGFSKLVQGREWASYLIDELSIDEQLNYKYIVVLEGNDVATSLKWVLKSNSIPIMPNPTKETWLMEGLLEPYQHYLPLNDDLSNLDELISWAENNPQKAIEIVDNGYQFMQMFEDEHNEHLIETMLVRSYLGNE